MFYIYRKVAVVAGLVFCLFSSAFAYSGGAGTEADPYRIAAVSDWNDLMNTQADWDKHFILIADVNLQGISLTPVGIDYSIPFIGVFDGNSHIIRNADISMPDADYIGLFGWVDESGQIRRLGLETAKITGGYYVGGLVGVNFGTIADCCAAGTGTAIGDVGVGGLVGVNLGSITTCYAAAAVSGSEFVGGLVGYNYYYYGSVNACYATGTVSGDYCVGGLVGINDYYGSIGDCFATGLVSGFDSVGGLVGENDGIISSCYATGSACGWGDVGGLVGTSFYGTITACYSTGTVDGSYSAGGLAGFNEGAITACYATGAVNGIQAVGGLVGYNYQNTITACYAAGAVAGDSYVGGLAGYNWGGGTITVCFWDIETSGLMSSAGGTGKTTAKMKVLSTFTSANWDFIDTWNIGENQTYPFLRKYSTGDLNLDKRVNFVDFVLFADDWLEGV